MDKELLERYRKYLTNAQVKELAAKAERYKLLNAQRRAEAQNSILAQQRQTRRGLQNVGLASREGKVISGMEASRNDALAKAYDTYNQQLQKVEEAQTQNEAVRMANATIAARQRAQQEAMLAQQQAQQEAAQAQRERNALRNQVRDKNQWNRQMTDTGDAPRKQPTQYEQAMSYALQQGANKADAVEFATQYVQQQKAYEQAKLNASTVQNWQQTMTGKEWDQEQTTPLPKVVQQEIQAAQAKWEAASKKAEGIETPKNRNEYERYKEAKIATREYADALSKANRMNIAEQNPQYSNYLLMSDEQFSVSYDAAKQQAERMRQQARILRKDSAESMDDLSSEAAELERKAMELLAPWDQANALRDGTGEAPSLSYTINVSARDKAKDYATMTQFVGKNQENWKAVPWANEKEWNGQNWKNAIDNDWSAEDYDKKHDTKGSKFAALINEWSFINGRTALLYTQKFQTVQNLSDIKELFSGDDNTRDDAYRTFRYRCMMAFYNDDYEATRSKAKLEQMDAMLTLANLMTDEERARFNGMLNAYGAKYADEYFEYLYNDVLPQRFRQYAQDEMAVDTSTGIDRVGQSILSVPNNIVQGVTAPLQTLFSKQTDPVAAQLSTAKANTAQSMRGAVGQHYGKVGSFLYQTGMSMADSATVAVISGGIGNALQGLGVAANVAGKIGSVLGGSILGGSAFNSSYQEALDRGLSPDKARATAFGNGVNEMLFEALSLDMLVGHFQHGGILKVSKNGFVNWLVNTMVQGGVEGSEEFFTDMANNLWDKKVNGIYSEELTKLREYISQGMSYDEAKRKVNAEFAEQLGMSFLGGMVSGGVMGGGATFMGMVQNRGNEKVGKGLRQNSRVMNELRNFDFKSEYAQEILQQKNLTNADIADLFNIMQQELLGQYKSDIQQAVADGKITQEQADLLKQYEQNGVQIVKDGDVIANENGITNEQMSTVQDAIANLDNAARIQFLNNEEMRSLVQAVGGETAAIIEQSETAEREAEKKYRQTVREINNDTTLSPELKQKRLEAAERTRQNARSEASKIADTALTNKKGIGAKLETDGNGTVKVGKGSGKVTYDFSTKDNPGHQTVDSMTATEQSALRIAKIVAASRPDVNVKVETEFVGEHANENGYYDRSTNTIHINMSGDNSVLWTLSHELTHHLANTDTEAYAALRTAIETAMKDSKLTTTELENRGFEYDLDRVDPYIAREGNLWDALVAFEREEHGYGKDAEEEVVARCCESFLGFDQFVKDFARKQYKSAKAVNKFIAQMNIDMQRVSEDARQSAAQRNVWNDESPENQILRQLTEIDRIANLWRIAVNAEAKKRQEASEGVRASKMDKTAQFEAHKYYDRIVQSMEEQNPTGYTKVGEIKEGSIYDEIGMPVGSTYFDNSKILKELNKKGDPLPVSYLQLVPEVLAHPIVIAEAKEDNTINVFGEILQETGNPLLVGIVATKDRNGRNVITKVRTTHQRFRDLANLITDQSVLYITENKKTAKAWFQASRINMPLGGNKFGFIRRITLSDDIVKLSELNSQKRFSMKDNVERKGDLIAVHNLSGDQLLRSMELGGFPMPSIAVMKQSQGHDRYGDVSVIFNKDTIDPKKSTANKVYGGDAWTPTYPTVEYKPRKTVADRIEKTYYDIARKYGYDAARPLYSYVYELERKLNNAGSEKALLDDLYNDTDMMRLYGQMNGKERVEDVYKETRTEMSENDKAVPQYFINALGEDFIREFGKVSGLAAFTYKKEYVQKHMKELDGVFSKMLREEYSFEEVQTNNVVENMTTREYMNQLQRALKILNNDTVKVERTFDKDATEKAIRSSIDEKAYKEWVYDLFHGVIEKSGIRNNQPYYTNSGNQRSWDALHDDETLENVVRVMRGMTEKGSDTPFSQNEMLAVGTRTFKSIDEIRQHKDQLKHVSEEEMHDAKQNIVDEFGKLMDEMRDKSEKNYFIGRDRALEAMVDAVRRTRTPQGILNELRQWHGLNVTEDMGRRIADLMDEIADLPTEYFEAKPRRAVGIDEIKAVIMPSGEYADLKSRLDERGIPVVEYEKDNEEDRLRALNSDAVNAQRFSKMDKVRLSTADGTRTYTLGDVTAKLYGNDVELDGGKVRQRVQMMEAIAEVNGTARVDAASEEEAEAFRRAGAEQVVEELEGHGAKYGTWVFKYEERKFTNDSRYDIKQKQKFAKDILKQVGKSSGFTQAQRVKYGAALGRLMDYLWEMQYGKMDGKVIFDFADRLFDRILNDYTALSEADEEFRSELLANMTKTKNAKGSTVYVLEVNDKQMREIKYAYENAMAYASKLSKAFGARVTVKQTENAKTLEDIFTNSTDTRIKSDTNEGDMPGELLRLAQETESRKTNPYAAESEERQALKMGMFEAAMAAAGVEKSTAQQIREAVKTARAEERAKARKKIEERDAKLKKEFRATAAKREARLKQKFKETTAKANETRLKRDMRTIALKWNQRLVKLLANPTEASHVPVQLAREVAELTKTITEYLDSGTERGRINLEKVIKAYQKAFDDQATIAEAQKENPKYDPRGAVIDREMYDEYLVQMMNRMNEIVAAKSFKDLSAYEMKALLDIIRGVAHTVYDANRMIGTSERKAIWEVGDQMVKELESAPKIRGSFARFFLEGSLDLRRIAKVFSGSNENAEFVKLSDMLNRGAIEKERVAQVLSGMFDPLTQQYGEDIRKWYGKKAEWIDTGITQNGRKVEITKGMRVSLAMHVLNAGNMRHIENGGVTIPNRELYAKGKLADAYANGTLVRLNADQINTIISQMTEAEKAYVEVAKEFFHQRTGYYVNKTSLQLLGYRKATVENYFPIHTDRNYTKSDFASVVRDGSIEGQGFLKERVNASNPVYLEDITSVVNRQIRGVALYAGLAVPMRNFNAVMNASVYEDENGNWVPRTTVRKAMTQSMGEYGAKVVQGFLQDVSGMSAVDVTPGEQIVAKLQTRYVKAVLLANLKVSLKQAASYPTAAAVIPWKYLSKALRKGESRVRKPGHIFTSANVDLINQYTPLYKMRLDGMANEITSIMAERGLEQKMPWLLGWITKMDVATVGRLWSAAEYMVADQQNLPVGSDEYYKAVAEVFNQTIQQTQPNFTPLQRNAALRSKNPVVRTLTLFGTQRMQNGGILIESAMELAHSKNMSKEAQAAAKAKFGRAVVSQLVQNVMLVAIGFVVDALRGRMTAWQDDDKDVTLESVAQVMGDQFLGNIFGSFLGGSEAWDIISTAFKRATNANAYDTEFTVPSLDAIETIIGFFNKDSVSFVQYMSGNHTAEEKIARLKSFSFKVAKAAGYLTGFPFENIAKTIVNGWIPALQDIKDYADTGELIPWLHQSGKLDKAKTAANYKEWTKAGFSGRDYFYYEKMMSDVKGGREGRIPVLLQSNLTNEQKAMLMRMFDTSGATSDGTKVYAKNGDLVIDFAAPTEKQQALPMPTEETATPTTTPTATPQPTENPLTDARQEGVKEAVAKGVPEQTAFDAFLAYQNMGKNKSDDYSRNDDFREWLFANVDSPEQRAVLEYQVIGTAKKVEGSVTYRDSGVVFRDYTNESWFKLSEHNLAKDGTNKRYEAGKRLEKTGLSVDKTVNLYDALAEYTKKSEWTEYLKKQGLTDEQIQIFLWSRGWAK